MLKLLKLTPLILLMVSSLALSSEENYKYYSLSGGEVVIEVEPTISGSGRYTEIGSADVWNISICRKEDAFVCFIGPRAVVSIPSDLTATINSAKICNEPSWKTQGHTFRVIAIEDHGIHACGTSIKMQGRSLLGVKFETVKVQVSNANNNAVTYFLWSITRGLVAFTNSAGEEFWLNSPCGFGASKECK